MEVKRRWSFRPHQPEAVAALSRALGVAPVVAQLLLARGVADTTAAAQFLDTRLSGLHEPDLLPGAAAAAERIARAVREGRPIVVYGDYDVDGVTGTAILVECLRLAGVNVSYYIPNRLEEGYGLNVAAVERLANVKASSLIAAGGREGPEAPLVISVDCGIADLAAARRAGELGIELIVTDHHEFAAELPEAAAIVHPRLPGSSYPFEHLSGAGVALKLAWAICRHVSDARRVSPVMRDFLLRSIALAALGAVADVVPLVGENRVLVHHGLVSLRERPSAGLRALMEVAKLHEKKALEVDDIGFALGPRLNAVGRLGQGRLAVELLTTADEARARKLAGYFDEQNALRQKVERRIWREAREQIENTRALEQPALVLADPSWHPGVVGIVAGRLAEQYQRPAILVVPAGDGSASPGSGRSIPGFDLHAALGGCADALVSYGGHACAAGIKILPANLARFRARFCEQAGAQLGEEHRAPVLRIDAEVPLAALTFRAVRELDRLAPFGPGNPRPVMAASRVELAGAPKRMGGGEHHLALRLRQNGTHLRAVAFGKGDDAAQLAANGAALDVAFAPVLNAYNGYVNVELRLIDWRHAE